MNEHIFDKSCFLSCECLPSVCPGPYSRSGGHYRPGGWGYPSPHWNSCSTGSCSSPCTSSLHSIQAVQKKTRQCNTTGSKAKLHYCRFLIKCIIRSWEISLEKLKILLFSEYIIHNKVWHSRFYRITIWNKTAKSHNKVLA